MGYTVLKDQPGLFPHEMAVRLDTGDLVAVSVSREWLLNGEGIVFKGQANAIDATGKPLSTPDGTAITSGYEFVANHVALQQYDPKDIAGEVALMVLGEPPALVTEVTYPPAGEGEPAQTYRIPFINVHDGERFAASIRHQLKVVDMAQSSEFKL